MLRYCVDLDGTLAYYKSGHVNEHGVNHIGDPLPGAKEFVDRLAKHIGNDGKPARIIIYTRRMSQVMMGERISLKMSIANWLNKHGFYWHEIYDSHGKPDGTAFIDDRGVQCRPQENPKAYEEAEEYILKVVLGV